MGVTTVPVDCKPDVVYLDRQEYMGMKTIYFNDGKGQEMAKACAEHLSSPTTKYEAVQTKVACASDFKVGNIWGYAVKKKTP